MAQIDYAMNLQPDPQRHYEFYEGVLTKRFIAWVVDFVVVALLTVLIVPLTAFTGLFFLPLLFLTIGFLYRWLTLSGRSSTWGMRLVNIRMLDRNGQRFDAATALAWTIGSMMTLAFVLPQILSVALMLLSQRGQSLTDHILGTVAINDSER